MSKRVRPVSVTIQFQFMIDDGAELIPVQSEPIIKLARDWPQFAAHGLQDALEKLQAQLDAQNTPAPGDADHGA